MCVMKARKQLKNFVSNSDDSDTSQLADTSDVVGDEDDDYKLQLSV